jgi:hypothetical protein
MCSDFLPRPRRAVVRFLTTEEGGRVTAPASGVRAQIEIGSVTTSCTVSRSDAEVAIPLGEEVQVLIELLFPEAYGDAFSGLSAFQLFEGSKRVADGRFINDDS